MPNDIALKIKALREELNLTQEEFAEYCGVSRASIARYELGTSKPNRDALAAIASATNTTVSALMGETDTSPRPTVSDEDIKFALFGGDAEITDAQFEEVKRYARYIKEREAGDK